MAGRKPSTPEFFWAGVQQGLTHECWPWMRHIDKNTGYGIDKNTGYGRLRYRFKRWRAHRLAYALTHPRWRGAGVICHTCDNPRCCNPAHLWRGTPTENAYDMIAKGRKADNRGEQQPHKLTEAQVLEIRASTLKQAELAAKYGVTQSCISMIRSRHLWTHI